MNRNYEICIMMSDQHSGQVCGFAGDPVIRTPNLDNLASKGIVFSNAYTPCPLCVPARAAFLTCRYPFDIGVGTNNQAYSSSEPTFIHSLGIAGYHTVLCGRMHFVGLDQRHGFDERIAKDICPIHPGRVFTGEHGLADNYRGVRMFSTYPEQDCASLHYDRYVTDTAVHFFSETHPEKQAVVVGTYMPHMPLGANEEKIAYYRGKVAQTLGSSKMNHPCGYLSKIGNFPSGDRDAMLECRATYYAMIETEDEMVGEVYQAYRNYLDRKGSKGIFIYLSDHGDHMGNRGRVGKQTFFEQSAKIPMIIVGDDIIHRTITSPVSLLDIGETLCTMTEAPHLPHSDGTDLSTIFNGGEITEKPVFSEILGNGKSEAKKVAGVMVRDKKYKFITYHGYEEQDLLFDLENDPAENINILCSHPAETEKYRSYIRTFTSGFFWKIPRVLENIEDSPNNLILKQWGMMHPHINDEETWYF
jgi:choline-sulfatase